MADKCLELARKSVGTHDLAPMHIRLETKVYLRESLGEAPVR